VFAGLFLFLKFRDATPTSAGNEIALIKQTKDVKQQSKYYRALIERVGPEQAQVDLYNSGLPFTGETHLINHTVGDYLYEKYGVEGITQCRNYFLESCYHGLLLHVIGGDADTDFEDVQNAVDHCFKAGNSVITQCAHGIGHGYVAAVGYANLDGALEQCSKIAARLPSFPVYNCHDGVFMENIWAVHGGEPSPDRWVKETDDVYPCNDARLKSEHLNPCWSNQPSLLYQRYGDFKKIGEICLTVTPEDAQQICFDGLSRQIHPLTRNQPDEVFKLCNKLPTNWRNACYLTNVIAAFSVGDRSMPFEVCARLQNAHKTECYQNLGVMIDVYAENPAQKKRFCNKITTEYSQYQGSCQ